MSFYHKLNLPADPLKPELKNQLWDLKKPGYSPRYSTQHFDAKQYIRQDIVDTLEKLGLPIKYFVDFGKKDVESARSFLHSDICYYNQKWTKIPMAINWDLTPGDTQFSWYDVGNLVPTDPPEPEINKLSVTIPQQHITKNFTIQLYKDTSETDYDRNNYDVSSCRLLESLRIEHSTAYLVRTDVPHQIIYRSENATGRMGISIRFDLDKVSTWDQAIDMLQPLIVN